MVTAYMDRAEGTAVGYDMAADVATAMSRAEGNAIGFPMLGIGAPPTIGAVPDALRLEIVDSTGAQLVNDFVARRNLTFSVEHNGSGSVSFETDLDAFDDGLDDPALGPDVLARVHFGDLPSWPYGVAEGLVVSAPPTKDGTGRWTLPVACPGSWDALDFGLLWPPAGATGDTREFSYTAGMTGPSWVPAQWGTPYGRNVKTSWRWDHRWPRGWPESKAEWLWSSSPEKPSPNGTRQFVGSFTLSAKKDVRFYVAGDDNLRLYLNGALLKKKASGAWKTTTAFTRTLKAGTYVVAASVANLPGTNNRSGFLFAAAQLKANGDRDQWLLKSKTSTFQIKKSSGYFAQVPLPPDGWYPADVLRQQVSEAAARGIDFHSAMTVTYTSTVDSGGSAWTAKGPVEYDIGISGAQLGEKIRALGVDVAMLPGLRLSAWKSRGFDLRDRVVIARAKTLGYPSRTWARVRTVALTHQEQGWTETAGDAGLSATYGRRELSVSGGGVDGDLQADVFAASALNTSASPEVTIEATVSSAQMVGDKPQPMPFRDYNVADIVTMETVGGFIPVKVMSIAGAEQDDRSVDFTIAGYPV